jgi:hypothetical protein
LPFGWWGRDREIDRLSCICLHMQITYKKQHISDTCVHIWYMYVYIIYGYIVQYMYCTCMCFFYLICMFRLVFGSSHSSKWPTCRGSKRTLMSPFTAFHSAYNGITYAFLFNLCVLTYSCPLDSKKKDSGMCFSMIFPDMIGDRFQNQGFAFVQWWAYWGHPYTVTMLLRPSKKKTGNEKMMVFPKQIGIVTLVLGGSNFSILIFVWKPVC